MHMNIKDDFYFSCYLKHENQADSFRVKTRFLMLTVNTSTCLYKNVTLEKYDY